ncbi:hypothetical protein [Roseateles flavus]|uniref:Uncharacterized protein n=1 Tax=Roseateles flavus TaxID=3149041 RepID=A0ABV0GG56_9BURK
MADLIFDDITPHLSLPLPHPSNDLGIDALRLRDALSAIDSKVAALDTLLQSNDVDLDQWQELVNAIKSNASDAVALLATKAGRDELAAVVADKASRAELGAVNTTLTNGLAGVARSTARASLIGITYDAQGRPQRVDETVAGLPRQTTLTYNSDGTVATVVSTFAGVTRTETYSYAGGRVTGMNATEI